MPHSQLAISADDVRAAAIRIKDAVKRTPISYSETLSSIIGADIFLKFEIFQFTAAYKERGALNRLLHLEKGIKGVIAMSAGNHAQGLSYHAKRLGIPATIVMPMGTPFNKVKRTEELGARVVLRGQDIEEATSAAKQIAAEDQLEFIHPFDDPLIMAGQGTVGLEMLEDQPDLDAIIVPIGGGGLISGIATTAKAINPDIEIIGLQTAAFPSMKETIDSRSYDGSKVTIAEGIAVGMPGFLTREVVRALVDDIILVRETDIETALVLLMEIEKVVVEGAAAIGIGALLANRERFQGKKVGVILTGGNVDSRLLASTIMRAMSRDGRLNRLRIAMRDTPGSLAAVTQIVSDVGANVIEMRHQREFGALSIKMTEMELVVETKDREHSNELTQRLKAAGFDVQSALTV